MSGDGTNQDSAYVGWKGWVDETPFGALDAGEAQYFRSEIRGLARHSAIGDVLEIGFGNGSFLTFCRNQGWNVTGTELEPELIDAGTRAGFTVITASETSNLADASFDLIALFDVLEHIPQDTIVGFLAELATKLRPGGQILLRFPNADSWLGNPLQNGDPTHVTQIGYLKMTFFAPRANLRIARFTGSRARGFATSAIHGIYSITGRPIARVIAAVTRALYFPQLPVVLWASNIVCVLEADDLSRS